MNKTRSCTAFMLSLGLVGIACQGQPAPPAEETPMNEPAVNTPAEAQQLTGEALASALHNAASPTSSKSWARWKATPTYRSASWTAASTSYQGIARSSPLETAVVEPRVPRLC